MRELRRPQDATRCGGDKSFARLGRHKRSHTPRRRIAARPERLPLVVLLRHQFPGSRTKRKLSFCSKIFPTPRWVRQPTALAISSCVWQASQSSKSAACSAASWLLWFSRTFPTKLSSPVIKSLIRAIARHQAIANTAHGPYLPSSWRTLYELSQRFDMSARLCVRRRELLVFVRRGLLEISYLFSGRVQVSVGTRSCQAGRLKTDIALPLDVALN